MTNWGILSSYIPSNILIWYFLLAALSWKILMCFQQRSDWSVSITAQQRKFYMLTTAGEISPGHVVIGKLICDENSVGSACWSILLFFHWLVTCSILDVDPASLTAMLLWNQLWRNGDIDLFDEFLCYEVNASGFDITRTFLEIESLHWILVVPMILRFSEAEMSMDWLQVCTSKDLAGIERVLNTEVYISCSRMLRPCHGCLDQRFDPFKGNGTSRYLGKVLMIMSFFHVVIWAEFYPNANEVSSTDLPKPRGNQPRWLVLFMQIIFGCCEITCWSDWKEIYHSWYYWIVHCMR